MRAREHGPGAYVTTGRGEELRKKAFKRAVGRLLKEGAVTIDRDGFLRAVGK